MNLVELLKLRPARALVAVAMVAGAAFAAVPAEAATTPGSLSISVDTTSPATFNKPVGYVVKVVNTTGQDLSNVIVGDGFVSGAKLSSGVTGLPSNSCVKGRLGFGCLVPTLPNNSEVDVFFTGTPNFFDLRSKNGLYPANPFAPSNPLQTFAFLQNHEDVWRVISTANSSARAVIASNTARRISPRSREAVAAHFSCTATAASSARTASSGVASATRVSTSPVAGLRTSKVRLPGAWRHWPS